LNNTQPTFRILNARSLRKSFTPNLWKSTFEKGGAKTGVPSGGGFPSGPVLVQIPTRGERVEI
jgi:hypothetical protein